MRKIFFLYAFLLSCIHLQAKNVQVLVFDYPVQTAEGVEYRGAVVALAEVYGMDINEQNNAIVLHTIHTDFEFSLTNPDYLGMPSPSVVNFNVETVDAVTLLKDKRLTYRFNDKGITLTNLPENARIQVSDTSGRTFKNVVARKECTLLRSELPRGIVIVQANGLTLKFNNR